MDMVIVRKILEYSLRSLLIAFPMQWVNIHMMDMGLVRQKKIWWVYLFMLGKTFLLVLYSNVLTFAQPADEIWSILYKLLDFFIGILVIVIFIWLWEDEPLHILLIVMVAENFVLSLMPAAWINLAEGREDIFEVSGPFHPADLLIPVSIFLVFYLLKPYLEKLMHYLGRLHLPYRKALWVVVMAFLVGARSSALLFNNTGKLAGTAVMIEICITMAAITAFLFQMIVFQYRFQREEENFLDLQIGLLRQRAVITRHTMEDMRRSRELIERQMKELEGESAGGSSVSKEEWEIWIQDLKQSLSSGYRGRYCRDILVDETLSYIAETAQEHGDEVGITLRGYERGKIGEEDIARILFCMMSCMDEHHGRTDIYLTGTGGQLIISAAADDLRIPGRRISLMQQIAGKYKGEVTVTRKQGKREAGVVLSST